MEPLNSLFCPGGGFLPPSSSVPGVCPGWGMMIKECLHPWVKVDQAGRPLPPKSLSILEGLMLKLDSLCIIVNVVVNI